MRRTSCRSGTRRRGGWTGRSGDGGLAAEGVEQDCVAGTGPAAGHHVPPLVNSFHAQRLLRGWCRGGGVVWCCFVGRVGRRERGGAAGGLGGAFTAGGFFTE